MNRPNRHVCIKNLSSTHRDLARAYNAIIINPEKCPKWITWAVTYLLPKTEETQNPKNYRPSTCLPTMYKIFTSVKPERTFFERNNLLPAEQKGCKRGNYGCKDQIIINKTILKEMKTKKRKLSTAWIDYKKAFDSVPYSWIEKSVKYTVCNPQWSNSLCDPQWSNSIERWYDHQPDTPKITM